MRFETDKNQVMCVRIIDGKDGEITEEIVTTFDAHLEEIAPHITACLYAKEQQELQQWFDDRTVLQEQSIREIILYALPGLLDEACSAINKLPTISDSLYQDLSIAINTFSDTVAKNKESISENKDIPDLKQMDSSEALKEVLGILKKNFRINLKEE